MRPQARKHTLSNEPLNNDQPEVSDWGEPAGEGHRQLVEHFVGRRLVLTAHARHDSSLGAAKQFLDHIVACEGPALRL